MLTVQSLRIRERDRKRGVGECMFGEACEEGRQTFKKSKIVPNKLDGDENKHDI